MMLLDPQENLRIVVSRGVRILLPRQRKNHSRILLPHRRKPVTSISSSNLYSGPLPPQVDSCGSLDHLIDVSAAHPRRTLQKVEMPIGMCLDEFRVRHTPY